MKKILCFVLSCMLLVTCGCNSKNKETSGNDSFEKGVIKYPVKTDVTLKVWDQLNGNVSAIAESENDLEFTRQLIKNTGINVEFIHPASGQAKEKFNLMLASGDLPDIVTYSLMSTSDSPDGLIQSGYVHELSEKFMSDYTPNFYKKIKGDILMDRAVKTVEGKYYGFPNVIGDESMTAFFGLIIRDDWLKELGLDMPNTIDEWNNVLTQFKNKKNASSPLTFDLDELLRFSGVFIGAYGIKMDFYVDNGKVKYGLLEPGSKEFFTEFAKWYKEGLIDQNIASIDQESMGTKMLNGNSGATVGYIGSDMGVWLKAKENDTYSICAAPYPTIKKGDLPEFGVKASRYSAPISWIAATSKNKEIAARFLDYAWTEEGKMYYNFGTEGVSYNMVDDYPTFSDLIYNDPDGLSVTQALTKYTHCTYNAAFETDKRFFKQQYLYDRQKEAIDVWANTNAASHILYGNNFIPGNEFTEYKNIASNIDSLVTEKSLQFIMGIESLDRYDSFIQDIKNLNVNRAIEILQKAYDKCID